MSGEVSETAGMTPQENVKDDGPGQAEGIPSAVDAGHQAQGEPTDYSENPDRDHTEAPGRGDS